MSKTLRAAWKNNPTSARIVEDVTRWPLVIEKIIEYKGGLVPDFSMAHDGCSKRKRSAHGSSFEPAPEVAAIGAEADSNPGDAETCGSIEGWQAARLPAHLARCTGGQEKRCTPLVGH